MIDTLKTYEHVANECVHCEKCINFCENLKEPNVDLGHYAQKMFDAFSCDEKIENQELTEILRSCFLCRYCVNECKSDIDVISLMLVGRQDYQNAGFIPRSAWVSVQVDQEWDIFKAYRAIYEIGYTDLYKHEDGDCELAFFPGCSLAAYAPELTREVFAEIEKLGGKTTLIDFCCGSPLKSAGFVDRAESLCKRIVEQIKQSGAKEVLCCCPGCYNILMEALNKYGSSAKACMLPIFLEEKGFCLSDFQIKQPKFFVSCQDHGANAAGSIKRLMNLPQDAPEICGGCCGAGGAVSAFKPQRQATKVSEVFAKCESGDTLISMCPTCTYTFAFQQISASAGKDIDNKNYLELIFSNDFNWQEVFKRLNEMWVGPYGTWLAQVFS